jgi:hypothetical protein
LSSRETTPLIRPIFKGKIPRGGLKKEKYCTGVSVFYNRRYFLNFRRYLKN